MEDELLFEKCGSTGVVTFNRPQARNALTFAMYESLADICARVLDRSIEGSPDRSSDRSSDRSPVGSCDGSPDGSSDELADIRCLIVTGAGDKAFAAGTDIAGFRGFRSEADALGYERTMDRVLGALEALPIPTIAAIRGACTGGGAAIAACCDLRMASDDLRYGFPIARTLGNCLSLQNLSRLVELLGSARTREILMTSRLIRADEALAIGLLTEVVDDPLAHAHALCEQLAGHAPLTLAATKEGLRRLREHAAAIDGDDLIVRCYTSEDFREGIEAFLAKRKPDWQGR